MWVLTYSGQLVNIAEARWIDCVEDQSGTISRTSPVEVRDPAVPRRWKVRVFYTEQDRGLAENVLFRSSEEKEARAVLHGLVMLVGAYNLRSVQSYGEASGLAEDPDMEGGRVMPLEEPVLRGRETVV